LHSLLHISDLHRSTTEPLHNDALLGALLADRNRYLLGTPATPNPTAIVVSGDLVHGAKLGDASFETTLKSQYDDAHDFLCRLCDDFLQGDRSQMVVIPGNHDVCWNTSIGSMVEVDPQDCPENIQAALNAPNSEYRWSWQRRCLYKIEDKTKYELRLQWYWNTIKKFYSGVKLPLPIDDVRGFNLFEIFGGQAIVGAFDSVEGNDCFSHIGDISREKISRCNRAISTLSSPHKLKMAVWHHSVQGPPKQTDYMDVESVYAMIGYGFQLGLHGHQHHSSTNSYYVHLPETLQMAVVSAGSVCAGTGDLPRGTDRQYNVISFNENFDSINVQVREMTNGGHFTKKTSGAFLSGFVKLDLASLPEAITSNFALSRADQNSIFEAEKLLAEGDASGANLALGNVTDKSNPYYRALSIRAKETLKDWGGLIGVIAHPQSSEELVLIIESYLQMGDPTSASRTLDEMIELIPDNSTASDLRSRIDAFKMMRGQ
jgi:Calcineurin-like phosphoesterase